MAEKRNQNSRIFGSTVKGVGSKPKSTRRSERNLTPEERDKQDQETLSAYQEWLQARNERIRRNMRR